MGLTNDINIAGSGGFIYPGTGSGGYLNQPQGIPYYQGVSVIDHIPEFQRDYNLRNALLTYIDEGRSNMTRVMFDWAKRNGTYVVSDVNHRWYLDYAPNQRFYLKAQNNQGGTAGTAFSESEFILESLEDVKRLQTGDTIALMFSYTNFARTTDAVVTTYTGDATIKVKTPSTTTPLQEICKVLEVNYSTGLVKVKRNFSFTSTGAVQDKKGKGFDVVPSTTVAPAANDVRLEDAFFVKMGNAQAEGRDDQLIWSKSNTWDWNMCQYVQRKWGSTDIQENIVKLGNGGLTTMQKNRRDALKEFYAELDYWFLLGTRGETTDSQGRWIGYAGGILETIRESHVESFQMPDYTSNGSQMGDFTIPNFNKKLEGKFYFGGQDKILLTGVDYHTAFATMLNLKTNNIPQIVDKWGVKGIEFMASNGGRLLVVPSDTMSLNGMSNYAILFDPSTFQYGHLENMDISIVDQHVNPNVHEKTGEIFGVITTKRTNPDANWLFVMVPNTQDS